LVAKPSCGFLTRETFDEKGAERFILALPRMSRLLEEALRRCQPI
jgi:hypothetical protein